MNARVKKFVKREIRKIVWGVAVGLFLFPPLSAAESTSDRRQSADQTNPSRPSTQAAIHTQNDPLWDPASESWDPFQEMERLQRHIGRVFNQSLNRVYGQTMGGSFQPYTDIEELADRFVVKADLPGMQKDQIKVDVTDKVLNISGERKTQKEVQRSGYYKSERSFGSFQRSIPLPEEVLADKVTAKYENGVLEITLPKAEPRKDEKIKSVIIE